MNSNYIILTALLLCSISLTGCATITTGPNQDISVDTGADAGAQCTLCNDRGTWKIASTPAHVIIDRDFGDMTVDCIKGDKTGKTTVSSATKPTALGNAILPGALLAAAIDIGSGSAFDYPEKISVPLAHTTH